MPHVNRGQYKLFEAFRAPYHMKHLRKSLHIIDQAYQMLPPHVQSPSAAGEPDPGWSCKTYCYGPADPDDCWKLEPFNGIISNAVNLVCLLNPRLLT